MSSGIPHYWLVDVAACTLEELRLADQTSSAALFVWIPGGLQSRRSVPARSGGLGRRWPFWPRKVPLESRSTAASLLGSSAGRHASCAPKAQSAPGVSIRKVPNRWDLFSAEGDYPESLVTFVAHEGDAYLRKPSFVDVQTMLVAHKELI